MLRTKAPFRIDIRQFRPGEKVALFNLNMKPVCHIFVLVFVVVVVGDEFELTGPAKRDWSWSTGS